MNDTPLARAVDHCGGQSALAKAIGVKQSYVWYWLNKGKGVPAEYCAKIEQATDGAITKQDLRPDLFLAGGDAPADQVAER